MTRWNRWIRLACAVALAIAAPSIAWAQSSWLTVTNCEMVTIEGQEYGRLTFDLKNPDGGPVDFVIWRPKPGDSGVVLSATLPAHWIESNAGVPEGWRVWYTDFEHAVPPGGSLAGIQIVLSEPMACYTLQFPGPLLGVIYPEWPVCFACPGVTPADENSWGRIKSQYR